MAILCLILVLRVLRTAASHPKRAVIVPVLIAVFLSTILDKLALIIEDLIASNASPLSPDHINRAARLQHRFRVADLHCDTLLWTSRDPLKSVTHPFNTNRTIGHVDLPRLLAGNIGIQVFAVSSMRKTTVYYSQANARLSQK